MELVEVSVKKLEDFFISEFGGVQQRLQEFHLRIIQQQHDLRKNQAQLDKLNTELRKGRGREKKWKSKWEETSIKLSEEIDELLSVKVKCKEFEDRLDKLETSHNQPISCSCSTQQGSKDDNDDTHELLNKLSMQFESQFEKWNRRQVGLLHKEVGKLKQVMGGLQRSQRRKYPPRLIPIARAKKDEDVEVLDIKPVLPIFSTKLAKAPPSESLPKNKKHESASSIWTIPDIDRIRKKWGLPTQSASDKSTPSGDKAVIDDDKQKDVHTFTLPVGDQVATFGCPKCGVQYPSQVECQLPAEFCKITGDPNSSENSSSPDGIETVDDGDTVILPTFAKPKLPRQRPHPPPSPGNSTTHAPDPNNELACLCGMSFKVKPGVRQHVRYHTMPWNYPCKFCGKRFPYGCNLKAHLRASHKIQRSFSSNTSLLGYAMMR